MGDRQTGYWAGGGGEDVGETTHPQPRPQGFQLNPIWTSGAPSVRTDGAFPAELSHQEERRLHPVQPSAPDSSPSR